MNETDERELVSRLKLLEKKLAKLEKLERIGKGYLEYVARLSQTGTSAPAITVLKNELGVTISAAHNFTGFCTLTASSAIFTTDKTLLIISNNGNYTGAAVKRFLCAYTGTTTTVNITAANDAGTLTDGFEAYLLIRVYP